MSKRVCIICLVCEATTKLFCMQAAQNEDERRYECLTGIKLKCPAYICQRCSIDLGLAANLKQKALDSAKCLTSSIGHNQFKVPAAKHTLATNHLIQPQIHSNMIPITPLITVTPLSKTETPQNQNLTPSSKTALPSNNSMSRTDKIMSSASIISSTIVNPPMNMEKITDLFKDKPNISIIKTKPHDPQIGDKTSKDPPKEQFPKDDNEKKAPVNSNSRITKRRQTVCAENFYEMQKKAESQAGRKLGSFQPKIIAVPKKIMCESDKKVDIKPAGIKQEKASQKRQAEVLIITENKKQKIEDHFTNQTKEQNQPPNKYTKRQRAGKTPEPEFQYWIKSKAKGYYIESFKSLDAANKHLESLPKDATFGPLSDD